MPESDETQPSKRENVWLNLGFNIVAPSLILIKGSKMADWLGIDASGDGASALIFAAALLFPLTYGIYDLATRKKWNVFSIVGLASVLLTGGIGLMKLSRECMIIKEGAVPLLLGIAVLATAFSKKPLAKLLLMNESLLDTNRIYALLDERNARGQFEAELRKATYLVAASFLVSSALNFALAASIFKSEAGTEAFNAELGKMTALSYPVIVLPTTLILMFALYKLFSSISKMTGMGIEEFFREQKK